MSDLAYKEERVVIKTKTKKDFILKSILRNWQLYVLIAPVLIYFILFQYWPMYGVQIAFKKFIITKGIMGSPWIGFTHFERFFNSHDFVRVIKNTFSISFYQIIVGFPMPIVLALMMNEIKNKAYKSVMQTVTYFPHFLSLVVLTGMVISFLSPNSGIVNTILKAVGIDPIPFMTESQWFQSIYVLSGIWQNTGWASILYLAALAGIDTALYEAAVVDGASKLKRILHITIPGILPVAIIMLILDMGKVMNVGFEKVFLMQNDLVLDSAEVISTYVYKVGLQQGRYDYASAVGLFNSLINFTMLISMNKLSKKVTETSLW